MLSWEEVGTSFKVVFRHFPGRTEDNYEKPQDCLYADILHAMHSWNKNLHMVFFRWFKYWKEICSMENITKYLWCPIHVCSWLLKLWTLPNVSPMVSKSGFSCYIHWGNTVCYEYIYKGSDSQPASQFIKPHIPTRQKQSLFSSKKFIFALCAF
jgi:hypothetical protein